MCQTRLVPELKKGQKFRFVYTSGGAVPYLETVGSFLFGAIKALGLRVSWFHYFPHTRTHPLTRMVGTARSRHLRRRGQESTIVGVRRCPALVRA